MRERVAVRLATEVTLQHTMIVAVLSPKGEGVRRFQKMLKELQDGH